MMVLLVFMDTNSASMGLKTFRTELSVSSVKLSYGSVLVLLAFNVKLIFLFFETTGIFTPINTRKRSENGRDEEKWASKRQSFQSVLTRPQNRCQRRLC